ncbi:MAG TPA: hypothetical protein VE573_06330 [Nitrososphaeraceae archaeon]|jgi:hypothetical protein|nr:hypothetical protein [Nitrososphaeraceae archaeon]
MDANIARVDLADNAAGGQTPVWMGQFFSLQAPRGFSCSLQLTDDILQRVMTIE